MNLVPSIVAVLTHDTVRASGRERQHRLESRHAACTGVFVCIQKGEFASDSRSRFTLNLVPSIVAVLTHDTVRASGRERQHRLESRHAACTGVFVCIQKGEFASDSRSRHHARRPESTLRKNSTCALDDTVLLLDGNAKTRLESRHGAFTGDRSQVLYTKIDRQPKRFTSSLGASGHEPTHDLGIITKATRDRPWDPSGLELETWHGKRPESKFVESTA